jgi:hypothetical protein
MAPPNPQDKDLLVLVEYLDGHRTEFSDPTRRSTIGYEGARKYLAEKQGLTADFSTKKIQKRFEKLWKNYRKQESLTFAEFFRVGGSCLDLSSLRGEDLASTSPHPETELSNTNPDAPDGWAVLEPGGSKDEVDSSIVRHYALPHRLSGSPQKPPGQIEKPGRISSEKSGTIRQQGPTDPHVEEAMVDICRIIRGISRTYQNVGFGKISFPNVNAIRNSNSTLYEIIRGAFGSSEHGTTTDDIVNVDIVSPNGDELLRSLIGWVTLKRALDSKLPSDFTEKNSLFRQYKSFVRKKCKCLPWCSCLT